MSGFAENEKSCSPMDCIDPSHMPVTGTILSQFAVIDRYFAGFPGPTEVSYLPAIMGNVISTYTHTAPLFSQPIFLILSPTRLLICRSASLVLGI